VTILEFAELFVVYRHARIALKSPIGGPTTWNKDILAARLLDAVPPTLCGRKKSRHRR
jgi:hypothetical protein